jgi:DNA-binding beta-propeller fold protein YncE
VDSAGNVYVAISGDNQVAKFNPTTTSFQLDPSFGTDGVIGNTDQSSGNGAGEFDSPYDVAISPDGQEIAVSDSGNHRLQWFATPDGHFTSSLGQPGSGVGQFNTPKGLVYDGVGKLYVVDSGNNRVVLAYGADFLGTSGSCGSALGQFQGPVNLGLGTRGIYVVDSGNNRIEVFDPLASGETPPFNPRLALANQFTPTLSQPSAASTCSDLLQEKLYVADTGNNRVLLVQLPADTPEAVWSAMKQRLLAGDIAGAIPYFAADAAEDYRQLYLAFSASELTSMISQIPAISPIFIEGDKAQYYFQQPIGGVTITFPIDFVKENGTWKILEY